MFRFIASLTSTLLLTTVASGNPMQPDRGTSTPTQPKASISRPSLPALPRLSSIVIIGDLRKAVFNTDQEIALGESINGYRLINLDNQTATLQRGSVTRTLTITTPGEFTLLPVNEE